MSDVDESKQQGESAGAASVGVPDARPDVPDALTGEQRAALDDEVAMAARVARRIAHSLAQLAEARAPEKRVRHETELMALRDQIGEARNEDVPALLAAMIHTAGVARIDGPKVTGSVDPATPYFGHLRLEEGGRKRDVLIGKRGMIDREAGVVIVDWRDAPVSRLYYRYDEGDEYEEELGEKVREGRMLVRRTVTFIDGELVRVRCPSGTFVRAGASRAERATAAQTWRALEARALPELKGGVGKAERAPPDGAARALPRGQLGAGLGNAHLRPDKHLPEIAALIDPQQFEAMTKPTSGLVILQGGAGSGKTTVALHRVAWLAYQGASADPGARSSAERLAYRPSHMAVVVAQPQLARYVEKLLPALDCEGVRVFAYASWVRSAVERLLGATRGGRKQKGRILGRRVIEEAPSEVSRTKKHPGMLAAIRAQWDKRCAALDEELARACAAPAALMADASATRLLEAWRTSIGLPLARAASLRERLRDVDPATSERVRKALTSFEQAADDVVGDWEELISDRSLLERTGLDAQTIEATLRHTLRQIEEPPDHADIDDEHKAPIDGFEDPDDPLQAFDAHDLPLLLCMWIERHGALQRGTAEIAYDHVVVDEAQDLSAVELAPLLVATGERRSVTLAGDVVQKVVFDVGYEDWRELEAQLEPFLLGKGALNVEPFRLSYRSTAEVVELAREVLGPLAPKEAPRAVRTGAPVEMFSFTDTGEEIAFLAESLRSLMAREPTASVALLCRYPERARFYAKMLADAEVPRLRLVLGQSGTSTADPHDDFSFTPGIDVTHVSRVKGLEYDYVILAEVTEAMYPDNVVARHLLHIGATRAAHQLWLTSSTQSPSPLLPARLVRESSI